MNLGLIKSKLSSPIDSKLKNFEKNKLASILVVIYGEQPIIVMTEKPRHLKFHAGEISFPGGKYEKTDSDLLETALRETREEIGLKISKNQVVGQLEPVQTLNSKFVIFPFVSIVEEISSLLPNSEVEKIFHIPLEPFLATMSDDLEPTHNSIQEMYTFEYRGKIIWGASARILKQIVNLLNP